MAETAKILNPERTVLLPAERAGCSLAASITAADVRELRRRYPGTPVVTYVNTYADVKAESDVCCTSSNAAQVVESLDAEQVIFLPDEYLARNVAASTSKQIVFPSAQPVSQERRAADSVQRPAVRDRGLARTVRGPRAVHGAGHPRRAGAVSGRGGAGAPGVQPGGRGGVQISRDRRAP